MFNGQQLNVTRALSPHSDIFSSKNQMKKSSYLLSHFNVSLISSLQLIKTVKVLHSGFTQINYRAEIDGG